METAGGGRAVRHSVWWLPRVPGPGTEQPGAVCSQVTPHQAFYTAPTGSEQMRTPPLIVLARRSHAPPTRGRGSACLQEASLASTSASASASVGLSEQGACRRQLHSHLRHQVQPTHLCSIKCSGCPGVGGLHSHLQGSLAQWIWEPWCSRQLTAPTKELRSWGSAEHPTFKS